MFRKAQSENDLSFFFFFFVKEYVCFSCKITNATCPVVAT